MSNAAIVLNLDSLQKSKSITWKIDEENSESKSPFCQGFGKQFYFLFLAVIWLKLIY